MILVSIYCNIFTAPKRSLAQGNVFIRVCHSVYKGLIGFPACITGHMTRVGCVHPGPGVSESGGVCMGGGRPHP